MTRFLPLLIVLAAAPALADDGPVPPSVGPSANDWLRVGLERYERGNLVGAIEAFERGHAREPRPMFLFALGQAHRKRGDCARARASFDAFLATRPSADAAAAAREQRESCEPPEPPPVEAPAPITAPAPAPAPPPPPPAAPSSPPWWSDRLVLGAGGGSVLLLGAGAALWLSASSAAGDAAAATTYDEHRRMRERAESRQLYGGVAFGLAATAAAVTVWRLTRDRGERTTITPAVTAEGAAVVLGGSF